MTEFSFLGELTLETSLIQRILKRSLRMMYRVEKKTKHTFLIQTITAKGQFTKNTQGWFLNNHHLTVK